jgi:DMSO/TMAO reductase YedYZ molybdopterin-dependent catalytic subunit
VLFAIDGEISIPRAFTFEELRASPEQIVERSMLLGGRALSAARLSMLVEGLGVKSWARFAIVRGSDGFIANIPVEAIADCLLVYAVGNQPLSSELGGPVRLLARGLGRCGNVKSVVSISFSVAAAEIKHACHHERARTHEDGVASARGPA